ncbi:MAG: DNA polymerase IV, partial [Gammaproteobacteria bacterium]|nr:DNA polymerase IV [Gammaproteobacteria bacterium]
GIHTIGDLRHQPRQVLDQLFGRWGEQLWALAHGIDDRPVIPDQEAKSISHETTFAEDVVDPEVLRERLLALTGQVARRLRRHRLRGRTVQIKIRFADFKTITRALTLASPTDVTQELWRAAETLLTRNLPRRQRGVRLLGVGVSGLEAGGYTQPELFTEAANAKQSKLDDVSDRIQGRFGTAALRRATHLKRGE